MLLQFFIKESGEQKNETGVMEKHAYLIIAHTDWSLLKTLVSLLDYELNDIYSILMLKSQQSPFRT